MSGGTPDSDQSLALPASGSACLYSRNLEWRSSDGTGFWYKFLYENKKAGQRTLLMKIDPGAYAPGHSHSELEQIYVIEGSFYDEEHTYTAGDYIIRAPGAEHTTGSRDGAVALVVYSTLENSTSV